MTDRQRIQQIEELLADLIRQGNRTEERVEMLYRELIGLRDKVAEMEERNAQNFGRVRQEIKALSEKVDREIDLVRQELKMDIAAVRTELKADIAQVRQEVAEVRQEVAEVRQEVAEVRQEVAGVKEELVGVRQEQVSQRVLLERILDRLEK